MSTNPSGSLPHGPPGVRPPVGVGGHVDMPSGDAYRFWVVGRIAASIRGAPSGPEFVPVAPARRRLRNLMNMWVAVLPLLVVVFEVIRRILAHYYSMDDVEGLIKAGLGSGRGESDFLHPVLYFLPAVALGISLIITFGTEAAARIFGLPQARFKGSVIALCSAALAMVPAALVGFWTAGARPHWFAVIVLTCFYIVPLAHLAYLVISILNNARRSLLDYAVGILVFVTAVFAAFSMLIGTDALAEAKEKRQAPGQGVARERIDGNELGSADSQQKDEPNEGSETMDSEGSGSSGENYWIVVPFFAVVLVGAGVTMWNYHAFLLSLGFGKSYAAYISALAENVVPVGRGLETDARAKLCKKIGQQLGPSLSGSPAAEYSIYICSAASPLGLRLSKSDGGEGREVLDPAISAGVGGVFTWVSKENRDWTTGCYQHLYIKVSEGIACRIYESAVKSGRRWPFVIDVDVLACSRLLAATVADSVYRSGVHRLMPTLDDKTSPKGGARRRWVRHVGILCACCDPFG